LYARVERIDAASGVARSSTRLRSAGSAMGKPCLVLAFAYRQPVICQPG